MRKNNRRSKQQTVGAEYTSSPSSSASLSPSSGDLERVRHLQQQNEALKKENEELRYKLQKENKCTDSAQKPKENNLEKLNFLEEQVLALKKKVAVQSQLSSRKQTGNEAVKRLQDEIQSLKAQKVQLQCKMKIESVEFRLCKALLEKEVLQLKKEGRKNEYEMHKLLALNQRQKMVMKRKTEEASWATTRLKELVESRKSLPRKTGVAKNIHGAQVQDIERELEVTEHVREVCAEYERQIEEMVEEVAKFKEEAEMLKQENLRLLLQDKELECSIKDSELQELKEQVVKLGSLVRQVEPKRVQVDHREKPQELVQPSVYRGHGIEIFEDTITSESEHSSVANASTGKTASGLCCSCSKKSLCKTMKCQCRATGGGCGASCGCTAFKCTNRGAVPTKLEGTPQSDLGENIVNCSEVVETEKIGDIVSQGAMLLQNALVEKPAKTKDNRGTRKMPLCDIGNKLIESKASKPCQKKKGRKPVIQLVTSSPTSPVLENTKKGHS